MSNASKGGTNERSSMRPMNTSREGSHRESIDTLFDLPPSRLLGNTRVLGYASFFLLSCFLLLSFFFLDFWKKEKISRFISKSVLRMRKVENINRRGFIGKTRGILCYIVFCNLDRESCSSLLMFPIELGNSLKNNFALTHQLCPGETTKARGGPLEIDTTSYK